ncbi:MAG: Rieske (2Fe-2S) protein [Bacteroidetes bacterium]|nr:Rieske (2Fe-2S) protein [Bacteroidota bacterium]
MNEKMNRMEFLKKLGLKGASLFAVYCTTSGLSSCINEPIDPTTPTGGTGNELSLDLSSSAYSKLNTIGNFVIVSSIVIARVSTSSFAALTQVCSHQGSKKVVFSSGEFYCPVHGARFDTTGKGLNSTGSRGLKTYLTDFQGTTLKVKL